MVQIGNRLSGLSEADWSSLVTRWQMPCGMRNGRAVQFLAPYSSSMLIYGSIPLSRRADPMLLKGARTPIVRDMGGFIIHPNMPGWLIPKTRDHGHGPLAMIVK